LVAGPPQRPGELDASPELEGRAGGHPVGGGAFRARDHFIVQVGTGLRSGELLGLRARRVDLAAGRIEVVDVRYDAGRFESGYKNRPTSDASIRAVPMAEPVAAAMARRLDGCGRDELVFCGPGGSNGIPRSTRSRLSVGTTAASTGWRRRWPSCPRCAPSPDQGRTRRGEAGRDTAVDLRCCGGGAEGI
jgi:integrase